MSTPPGRQGRLSLEFAVWVLGHVKPALWMKALNVGVLLEARMGERAIHEGVDAMPVSLYYAWLYEGVNNAAGIKSLRGVLFDYDEQAYRRPGPNGEPGDCRTYSVKAAVVRCIQAGPHLEVRGNGLRCVMAYLLKRSGKSLAEIAMRLRGHKERCAKPSTVSGWAGRGQRLIEEVTSLDAPVFDGLEREGLEGSVISRGIQIMATLDSRGKLTIPAATRRAIGVQFGDCVRLEVWRPRVGENP